MSRLHPPSMQREPENKRKHSRCDSARLTSRVILCIGREFALSSQLVFNTRNARKDAESSLCGPDPSAASDCADAAGACEVEVACDAEAEAEPVEATRTPILTTKPSLIAPAIAPLQWPDARKKNETGRRSGQWKGAHRQNETRRWRRGPLSASEDRRRQDAGQGTLIRRILLHR